MIPLAAVRELFDFNYWARDRQLVVCATLTPEQFLRPMGSSFASVRDTLAHLLGAEWIWLQRWRGRSPKLTDADTQDFLPDQLPTLVVIRERWRGVEHDAKQYLASLQQEALAEPLTYVNTKGETWTYPLERTLLHVITHQAYHRGQVTTLLRQLGAEPPAVDFLVAHDLGFQVR